MKKRMGVQFRKSRKTARVFERLLTCKRCRTYHVLWETHCDECGREYVPIRHISSVVSRRHVQTRFLLLGLFICLAVLCAETVAQLAIAFGGGIVLGVLFFLMQKKYGTYEKQDHFRQFLTLELENIRKSLARHLQEIGEDVKAERIKDAYEKTREVGYFIESDTIKIRKIMFLGEFVLRKDMELELETVVPATYDKDFIEYLREVVKVQPALVKKRVLDYVQRYKTQILLHENGEQLIGQVAGAALRMKPYVEQYQDLIIEFIDYLPKDRLLRLARLVQAHRQDGWDRLYDAAKRRIDAHYSVDPEFAGIL